MLGLIGAIAFTPVLGAMLPTISGYPAVPYIVAFALIVIGAAAAGRADRMAAVEGGRAAGLGFVDRFLGSIFGVVRGAALMLAFVIVAGLTPLPRTGWWQRAALVPPLVAGVAALKPYLPDELARRLDYSPGTRTRDPAQGEAA